MFRPVSAPRSLSLSQDWSRGARRSTLRSSSCSLFGFQARLYYLLLLFYFQILLSSVDMVLPCFIPKKFRCGLQDANTIKQSPSIQAALLW